LNKDKSKYANDSEIIKRIKSGDSYAFEELYYKYVDKVFYFNLRYLRNREDAEGLTQEIFIKIWEIRDTLNPELSLNSYIFTIAKNTIFNKNRKKINEQAYKEYLRNHLDKVYDKTENDILLNEVRDWIHKAVNDLPPQRRNIFKLSRFEGLSYKEISSRLNLSERTVESHIRLALKSIRNLIDHNFLIITAFISYLFHTFSSLFIL
jgi:RNA polymerase sigma-70 factor (ECF subfamily)